MGLKPRNSFLGKLVEVIECHSNISGKIWVGIFTMNKKSIATRVSFTD